MEKSPEGAAADRENAPDSVLLPSPDLLRNALADEQDEVQRRIDAGASSPEDLRALAALMREKRKREASVWAREVRPGLKKARKARLRLGGLRDEGEDHDPSQRTFLLIVGAVALVALALLFAMDLSFTVLLVPVLAFLGYAWWLGTHPPPEGDAVGAAPDDDASA